MPETRIELDIFEKDKPQNGIEFHIGDAPIDPDGPRLRIKLGSRVINLSAIHFMTVLTEQFGHLAQKKESK